MTGPCRAEPDCNQLTQFMPRLFMTYAEVVEALMAAGLRRREARARLVLGQEQVTPHGHTMHTQRRWLRTVVVRYCEELTRTVA